MSKDGIALGIGVLGFRVAIFVLGWVAKHVNPNFGCIRRIVLELYCGGIVFARDGVKSEILAFNLKCIKTLFRPF